LLHFITVKLLLKQSVLKQVTIVLLHERRCLTCSRCGRNQIIHSTLRINRSVLHFDPVELFLRIMPIQVSR